MLFKDFSFTDVVVACIGLPSELSILNSYQTVYVNQCDLQTNVILLRALPAWTKPLLSWR